MTRSFMVCTPHQILFGYQINEMGGTCIPYAEGRGAYGILVGKTERRRPLGRHRGRWDDNIMDLQEVG
jgi:hypothetical protein